MLQTENAEMMLVNVAFTSKVFVKGEVGKIASKNYFVKCVVLTPCFLNTHLFNLLENEGIIETSPR
jgi:hypothetical protein